MGWTHRTHRPSVAFLFSQGKEKIQSLESHLKFVTVSRNGISFIRGYKRELRLLPPYLLGEFVHGILYSSGSRTVCKKTSREDIIIQLRKGPKRAIEEEKKMYGNFRLGN